ncbi:MAG TPA: bifunctional DNA-formamidopyrimidine glycosylase/DNA-(apurinic or apyrimidinic site) lyase [Acidobacteriota bacterium]|nr:bifunctional DNA-formamidopyrimidine glycosylase/DNA-(apurinic or apyrimidinic site) lyase [Acidobacteriota bacterium]
MPELPEVETIVRGLAPRLEGAELGLARLLFPPLLRRPSGRGLAVLEGKRVLGLRRRGKMVLISCEGGWTLVFHLKMTGQLLLARPADPVDKHTRLLIPLAGRGLELRFRDVRKFGFLCCLGPGPASSAPELDGLGPEPLETGRAAFAERFRGRKGRIKSLLLDQRVVAGIGNIYADEILFRARIHPLTPAAALGDAELETLRRSVRAVLRRAIARKGSTIRNYTDPDGEPGDFQSLHKVYGREGKACRACGTLVRRVRVGGRSTFFCPACQRKARARRSG